MATPVEIYTDGACRGNPGPGGWGALLRFKGSERELYGAEAMTTNNRMEMLAAVSALESLTRRCTVSLTTDSRYLCDGVTRWLAGWKRRAWKTAAGSPVRNQDLWLRLDDLLGRHEIQWHWVKGHSGHQDNERVDRLANHAIETLLID